jgi:hypothetical protein
LAQWLADYPHATVALEASTHNREIGRSFAAAFVEFGVELVH